MEIIQANLIKNLQFFRSILPKDVRLAGVLKANAYGHGLAQLARLVGELTDTVMVYDAFELKVLRERYSGPVQLLGQIDPGELISVIQMGPTLTVHSISQLVQLEEIAKSLRKKVSFHLSIDANFGREGILPSDIPPLIECLRSTSYAQLTGVFAHISSSGEEGDGASIAVQEKILLEVVETLRFARFLVETVHLYSSGSSLQRRGKVDPTNLVRIGLGMYGVWPSPWLQSLYPPKSLMPIVRWKSWVAQIKTLPKSHPVGYAQSYKTSVSTKIALIPQGYGHGYPRACSNRGRVLIRGYYCPILGRVSMNCIVVDVSQIPNLKEGEEVVLLGDQLENHILVEELAEFRDTIGYEILTSISADIPRILV